MAVIINIGGDLLNLNIKELTVTQVSHSSGIFSGENLQVDWRFSKKVNEGFGTITGNDNMVSHNQHVIQKHILGHKKSDGGSIG